LTCKDVKEIVRAVVLVARREFRGFRREVERLLAERREEKKRKK